MALKARCGAVVALLLILGRYCIRAERLRYGSALRRRHRHYRRRASRCDCRCAQHRHRVDPFVRGHQRGRPFLRVPALDSASYTVTCSLSGFKTAVIKHLMILTAIPADLKVTLEVGDITEIVQVVAGSEVVQRQSTTVSSTLSSDQIRNLPLDTKDGLNFVTFLPGIDTGASHNIRNAMSAVGLPQSAVVISIDGIPTQHPITKSTDGVWSYISPQIDAMEQVTVATATPGADASAHGAVQIRFTTRSGTDRYTGTFFETWRDSVLNANTFFNKVNGLPVNQITMNQYGGNAGGPIVIGFGSAPQSVFLR